MLSTNMQKSVPGAHETAFASPDGSGSVLGRNSGPLSWTSGLAAAARQVVAVGHESPLTDDWSGSIRCAGSQLGAVADAEAAAPSSTASIVATMTTVPFTAPLARILPCAPEKSKSADGRRPNRLPAVAVPTEAIGKTYAPVNYAVGREKIREYASAVGETNPLHHDVRAAREAGYKDIVAPPMFAVVYAGRAVGPILFDPELKINFAMLVHGSQEFRWEHVVVAGDEIDTVVTVKEIVERAGLTFYVFQSESINQRAQTACVGTWTNIIREG
jgi:acyl dehydratase